MNGNNQEPMITQSLLNSIDREELLIKKYNEYQVSIESSEWKGILKEFKKNSQEHIDMIKNKLQRFNS